MKFSNYFICLVICLVLFLNQTRVWGQEGPVNETTAIDYFTKGQYEKALPLFSRLIKEKPDNAMYNYYFGVSLLKNNRFEMATKEALLNAVVDQTPSNVNFYLGNYFHALGNWSEALDFYNRYKGTSQEKKTLEFEKYVSLCEKHINPFTIPKPADSTVFENAAKLNSGLIEQKGYQIPDSLRSSWFSFPINSDLTYHKIDDFKSEAAKVLFVRAWVASSKNDSLVKQTDRLRQAHAETNNVAARIGLVQQIVDAEQQSYQLIRDREKCFDQAREKESLYWENAGVEKMTAFKELINRRDSVKQAELMSAKIKLDKEREMAQMAEKALLEAEERKAQAFRDSIDKSKSAVQQQVQGVIYKVQIGTCPAGKMPQSFKNLYNKLSKLRKIDKYVDAKKTEIYTIGNFVDYKDASMLKNQLIMEGVKGAYLAAFKDGVRVPVNTVMPPISHKKK